MKSDKRQTYILIGIGLMAVAAVLLYVCFSQPAFVAEPAAAASSAAAASASDTAAASAGALQTTAAATPEQTTTVKEFTYPINLNTATQEELLSINGIGEKRAAQILAYRDELGGYTSVEQIKNISGIGDVVYAQIAPYLTV